MEGKYGNIKLMLSLMLRPEVLNTEVLIAHVPGLPVLETEIWSNWSVAAMRNTRRRAYQARDEKVDLQTPRANSSRTDKTDDLLDAIKSPDDGRSPPDLR